MITDPGGHDADSLIINAGIRSIAEAYADLKQPIFRSQN